MVINCEKGKGWTCMEWSNEILLLIVTTQTYYTVYLLEKSWLLISRSQFHAARQAFSAFHPKNRERWERESMKALQYPSWGTFFININTLSTFIILLKKLTVVIIRFQLWHKESTLKHILICKKIKYKSHGVLSLYLTHSNNL